LHQKNEGGFTSEHETKTNQLLDENLQVINVMRENLVNGKINENIELMIRFQSNISTVLKMLAVLSGTSSAQMPPLPVKLNTSLFPANSLQPNQNTLLTSTASIFT